MSAFAPIADVEQGMANGGMIAATNHKLMGKRGEVILLAVACLSKLSLLCSRTTATLFVRSPAHFYIQAFWMFSL